jgi:hypothetical protein
MFRIDNLVPDLCNKNSPRSQMTTQSLSCCDHQKSIEAKTSLVKPRNFCLVDFDRVKPRDDQMISGTDRYRNNILEQSKEEREISIKNQIAS